eukprot:4948032-Pleurochrysis_carterae.AAC.1
MHFDLVHPAEGDARMRKGAARRDGSGVDVKRRVPWQFARSAGVNGKELEVTLYHVRHEIEALSLGDLAVLPTCKPVPTT